MIALRTERRAALGYACGMLLWAGGALAQTPGQSTPPVQHFDVLEYRVLGNTVLPVPDVERAVYPHLGPNKSLEDVEAARSALEQAYKTAGRGTVFVDIPEQDVNGGVIRLKVTEGRLNRVRVEGAKYTSARDIREALPSAEPTTVPDLPAIQKEIATLNAETRDRNVVPVLAAGPVPGTVDLTLKVSDNLALHGSFEVNDQYTADTSRLRAVASVSYDNLFNRFDSFSLQYQTTPQELSEMGVFVASYTHRLDNGNRLAVYFVDSDSDVASLGTLSVLGKGKVYGSRLIVPVLNTAASSHSFTFGADYKDFLESIQLDSDASFQTPINYMNLSVGESSSWRAERLQVMLDTTANFGPRRGYNSDEEFADKRFKGRPNYFYVRASSAARYSLFKSLTVAFSVAGQYALEPIIGNEQFAIGGADGVRGYLEAEELGDIGLKGSLQFETAPWSLMGGSLRTYALAFFDAGRVSTIEPLPDEPRNTDLRSWGLGLNFAILEHFDASLAWAYPLLTGNRTERGDSRLLFSVRASW